MNNLTLKTYAYVFMSSVTCCYAYVDCTHGNACVVYVWYVIFFMLGIFRMQRCGQCMWKLCYSVNYSFCSCYFCSYFWTSCSSIYFFIVVSCVHLSNKIQKRLFTSHIRTWSLKFFCHWKWSYLKVKWLALACAFWILLVGKVCS
jgi:hypothetical protein